VHPDHAAELPAVLWPEGGSFKISGPSGAGSFPALEDFLHSLFSESGAFGVFSDRLELDPITLDVSNGEPAEVWRDGEILVQGKSVPHGDVPAIGYRIDVGDFNIAFASDQNGSDPSWAEFIKDIDILVVHFGTTEDRNTPLHAKPSVWGQMATDANAGHVVVSHIATSSDEVLQASVEYLKSNYSGPVTVADDLMCIEVI
jgi:ribonuclease BN (tRNA processing enzyme)